MINLTNLFVSLTVTPIIMMILFLPNLDLERVCKFPEKYAVTVTAVYVLIAVAIYCRLQFC